MPLQTKLRVRNKTPQRHPRQTSDGFNASASTTVRINQASMGLSDVTMPFENRYAAFQAARQEKQKKYAPLAEHYNRQAYSVFLDAFIVGALGGWDPAN